MDVFVEGAVARRQHFEDVLLHPPPFAASRFDAEAGPEVEVVIDDRLAAGEKDDAAILAALGVLKPPLADGMAAAVHGEVHLASR